MAAKPTDEGALIVPHSRNNRSLNRRLIGNDPLAYF
jgi:hypothetical protein